MDIEMQNRKREALLKNGKYQYTFKPIASDEKNQNISYGMCWG